MTRLLVTLSVIVAIGLGIAGVLAFTIGNRPQSPEQPLLGQTTLPSPTPAVLATRSPVGIVVPASQAAPTPANGGTAPVVVSSKFGAPIPARPGTFPIIVDLTAGETVPFILTGGARRSVTLEWTRLVFASEGVTVWAEAKITVSGNGLAPESAIIPAVYFRAPTVLNGVRVYVAVTKEFNDGALRGGGGTLKAARLILSDSRYTMTDVSRYRWPFPGLIWQEGSHVTYPFGLQEGDEGLIHHRGMDIGMPKGTRVEAWTSGVLNGVNRGYDNIAYLMQTGDTRSRANEHRLLHLEDVNWKAIGERLKIGDYVGTSGGSIGMDGKVQWYHTHVDGDVEWGPMFAEWYTAHASPVALSYVKDWLVAGPFRNPEGATRLFADYLGGEGSSKPVAGGAAGSAQWKLWDNVVPGVVDVGETLDPYPFSGWAWVTGNYIDSSAYLATYVYSEGPRRVLLKAGSSDLVRIWLDEREVFLHTGYAANGLDDTRTIQVDQFSVPVELRPGWNRLLVKVSQRAKAPKAWQFSLRIADEEGNPVPDLVISPSQDQTATPRLMAPPLGTQPPVPVGPSVESPRASSQQPGSGQAAQTTEQTSN